MPQGYVKDWTQIMPYPNATDMHFRISANLALITAWNAALSGQFEIADVLQVIARQAGARSISIYRKIDDKIFPISAAARSDVRQSAELSSGNIIRYLDAAHKYDLVPGKIFRLSALRNDPEFVKSAGFREWETRTNILDVSVMILDETDHSTDVMEFIFDGPIKSHPDLPAEIVTQAMANAWELRSPGLMTCLIQNFGRTRSLNTVQDDSPILSSDNPCGLSRAEQRVCAMLVDGVPAKGITEALGLSMPTVRSHLRNIYAKTETSGQIELLAVINGRRNSRN